MPPGIRCSRKWLVLGLEAWSQVKVKVKVNFKSSAALFAGWVGGGGGGGGGGRAGRGGGGGGRRGPPPPPPPPPPRPPPPPPPPPPPAPRHTLGAALRARSRTRAASCARTGGGVVPSLARHLPTLTHDLPPSPRTHRNRPASAMHWPRLILPLPWPWPWSLPLPKGHQPTVERRRGWGCGALRRMDAPTELTRTYLQRAPQPHPCRRRPRSRHTKAPAPKLRLRLWLWLRLRLQISPLLQTYRS
ncbi:hypothetical protein ABIA71_002001 [Stenotrophomonas sp. 2619]